MKDCNYSAAEWNIKTNIGPIVFKIFAGAAFFDNIPHLNIERHTHATYELHFITKGSGTVYTDETRYEIAPGSYYLMNSGVYHMQTSPASDPIHKYSCKFEFEISNIANNVGNDNYSEEEIKNFVYALSNVQFFYSRNLNKIRNLILEIQSELIHRDSGYYTKVQYLLALLFIGILREIPADYKNTGYSRRLKAAPILYKNDRISIIDSYFDLNYNHKATIKDLCSLVHLSKSQLNRILKEKYGMTFKQKYIEAQIEHIKDMLNHTDLPIKIIAEKTGYVSESNFTNFFKHATGLSPKAYRKARGPGSEGMG